MSWDHGASGRADRLGLRGGIVRENSLYAGVGDAEDVTYEEIRNGYSDDGYCFASSPDDEHVYASPDGDDEDCEPQPPRRPTLPPRDAPINHPVQAASPLTRAGAMRKPRRGSRPREPSQPRQPPGRAPDAPPTLRPPKGGAEGPARADRPARAPPGAGVGTSKKPLQFSQAPATAGARWAGSTSAFNRAIFCECVATLASFYARQAAEGIWDRDPPRCNEQLDRLLRAAAIKVTVCEGADLVSSANAARAGARAPTSADGHADGSADPKTPRGRRKSQPR
ncbi:tegument protein VP22 [Beluga whale alphaherpesvirus 1]|uniref:Tegument protein VP22 n=1 Tax=Beluga whale alphaherpesvirus 1 TaxID=1434720 RepID=A0A286RUH5_9ALPH|nr:tegument protein VP22 [Beluga whale alphaherpesvirus 1]ASW27057.1 tegument protein VP22 [Beluga whale alphaherpesvirus 1]